MNDEKMALWEQTLNYLIHSGLTPLQVEEAISIFQSKEVETFSQLLTLTQNEFIFLKQLTQRLLTEFEAENDLKLNIQLTLPESVDLSSIHKKLWYAQPKKGSNSNAL